MKKPRKKPDAMERLVNVWASWWTPSVRECPFGAYVSGYRGGWDDASPEEASLCMWFKATSDSAVRKAIAKEYPGCEIRFVTVQPEGFNPGDRFPGMKPFAIRNAVLGKGRK